MFGFDMEDIMNGFSKQDEYITRDTLILELLVEKGIITKEEIKNKFDNLEERVKETHEYRVNEVKRKAEEAEKRLKEFYDKGSDSSDS